MTNLSLFQFLQSLIMQFVGGMFVWLWMGLCVMLLHLENNCNCVVNDPRNLSVHVFLFKHGKMVDCDVDNQSDSL
jgi:hypothetical protein